MSKLYKSLFNGPDEVILTAEQQAELDRLEAEAQERTSAMTEEEKIAEFNRIMGRKNV